MSGEARCLAGVLALPLLLLAASVSPAQTPREPGPYQIAVKVELVEVYATVRDRAGATVSDLAQEHFEIREDGVRQTIRVFRREDAPVTVGLVVDHSRSMGAKLPEVMAAARTFVQVSRVEDEIFVVNFNEHVTRGLPAGIPFTRNSDELEQAISGNGADGMTALYDAVFEARKHLQTASRNKRVLIVISDGGDNASTHTLDETLRMAQESSTIVYTIGVFDAQDPDRNPGVLRRLAQATGGEAFFPEDLSEVVSICQRIARDIRSQYTLGYVSTGTKNAGDFRKIRVTTKVKGRSSLTVRARDGYVAK